MWNFYFGPARDREREREREREEQHMVGAAPGIRKVKDSRLKKYFRNLRKRPTQNWQPL